MVDDPAGLPGLWRLSRRDFMALAAACGVVMAADPPAAVAEPAIPEARRIALPERPSQNPGFQARALPAGELLLWAVRPGGDAVSFRLNAAGRRVWRLCDGTRTPAEVAREWTVVSGRPSAEATAFLEAALAAGVIASGATVVPGPGFPRPPRGGAYHRRIAPDDPAA